jgi:HSP20 family protein
MNKVSHWKSGLDHAWQSMSEGLSEGWRELRDGATGALTRFRRAARNDAEDGDSDEPPVAGRWGFLAVDLFDDDERIVVRLEAPGMKRDDFEIDLHDRVLVVRGRKRFQRELGSGDWRMVQCAYGSFRRDVKLPTRVQAGKAAASYRAGVLRIELPKDPSARPQRIVVPVH